MRAWLVISGDGNKAIVPQKSDKAGRPELASLDTILFRTMSQAEGAKVTLEIWIAPHRTFVRNYQ